MNIDQLLNNFKCEKFGNPTSATIIGQLHPDILKTAQETILNNYNLEDEFYATKEQVFFDTRRIVAKNSNIKTEKQLYTEVDFDYKLMEIVQPIIDNIKEVIGEANPSLVQIATILPGQKLSWHVDTFLYQQFSNKIHIPLFSNPNAYYDVIVNGNIKRINMTVGNIWNINNLDLHRSINLGKTFRSHLILDFIDTDVLEVLNKSGINYFHHRLPHMSKHESIQMELLKKYI